MLFLAQAAKRLAQLGAILHGDRRALGAGCELKAFDIDNKHGAEALKQMYHYVLTGEDEDGKLGSVMPQFPQDCGSFADYGKEMLKVCACWVLMCWGM